MEDKADWSCDSCHTNNYAQELSCRVCGRKAGSATSVPALTEHRPRTVTHDKTAASVESRHKNLPRPTSTPAPVPPSRPAPPKPPVPPKSPPAPARPGAAKRAPRPVLRFFLIVIAVVILIPVVIVAALLTVLHLLGHV